MYHMTRDEYDAVHDAVKHQLFRLNQKVKAVFGQDMTDDELRATHSNIQQGVQQAIQAKEQQAAMRPQLARSDFNAPDFANRILQGEDLRRGMTDTEQIQPQLDRSRTEREMIRQLERLRNQRGLMGGTV